MRRGAIILAAFSVACTGTQTSPDPDLLKGRTGMGIVVYVDATGDWIVRGLLPNSPAERAGIQVGDRLLSIAGIRLGARSDDGRQATRAGGFARVEEALSSTRFVEVAIERDGPVSVSLEPSSLFDMVIDHSSGNARGDASDNGRGGLRPSGCSGMCYDCTAPSCSCTWSGQAFCQTSCPFNCHTV